VASLASPEPAAKFEFKVEISAKAIGLHEATLRFLILLASSLPLAGTTFACAAGSPQQKSADERLTLLGSTDARSYTLGGHPGDPLNIAVIGSEDQLLRIMADAHWDPADPITVRSSLRIAIDTVVRRPYADAPVSNLYVNGKKQDLAFEQPAAGNPSRRHHVRFWRIDPQNPSDPPAWIGAATFDASIGISRTNGHLTHHIAADVDSERDKLLGDIQHAGNVAIRWIDGFQTDLQGRNGGGDPYHTDGRLAVITIETAR